MIYDDTRDPNDEAWEKEENKGLLWNADDIAWKGPAPIPEENITTDQELPSVGMGWKAGDRKEELMAKEAAGTIDNQEFYNLHEAGGYLKDAPTLDKMLIMFAQYHVKLALKAAHKQMQLPDEDLQFILDTYPESNIK